MRRQPALAGTVFCSVFLLSGLSACGVTDESEPAALSISNVTVIDARSGALPGRTVIVDGDRIVAVYAVGAESVETLESVDGTGKFLIPGLWDMHVHLSYDDRFTATMPETFIRYGITSVRDTGGLLARLLPVVRRMRADDAIAPRVFFSGPLLDGNPVVYDGVDVPELGVGNETAEEAAANVAQLKEQGASFIKIYEMTSPQVFAALVEAAERYQLPIAAHVPLSMRASQIGPSVSSIEHLRNVELDCTADAESLLEARRETLAGDAQGNGFKLRSAIHRMQRMDAIGSLDEEACARVLGMLETSIQVPTARLNTLNMFPAFERDDWAEAVAEMPAEVRMEWRDSPSWFNPDPAERDLRFARYTLDMILRMHRAGVPIGAGTDTPIAYAIPGYSLHNELEILVAAGLTPLEALRSATVVPASFFSLQDEMGAIAPGMRADLVLLDANPLEDIRNTRRIDLVIARGRIMP
ncbi:MAG: amidohydrolase family protein [Pseudomonadota bacterium]